MTPRVPDVGNAVLSHVCAAASGRGRCGMDFRILPDECWHGGRKRLGRILVIGNGSAVR